MMKTSSRREEQMFFAIGLILMCVVVVCNEWTLTRAFSADGVLEVYTKVKIWIFDIALILVGFVLVKYRKSKEVVLQFSQSHPVVLDALIGVVIAIIMLLCAEWGVFYTLNHYRDKRVELTWTEKLTHDDELLGYSAKPNTQSSAMKKFNGEIVYDVIYSIDEYGRRITPAKNPSLRTNLILFFGGSFTFGEGVNDNETMPFFVSESAPHYRPYNYGYRGYGPQQMLARLQDSEMIEEMEMNEGHGILIYIFIDHHIGRAIGSMHHTSSYASNTPYYFIDDNDRVIRKGSFASGRPTVTYLYRLIGRSQFVKYFSIDHPRINDEHIGRTARIIEESRDAFREKFNSDDYYVLIYPGSRYGQRLIPYFESAGIEYLDYSDLIDPTRKEFHLEEGDGRHPTAQAYKTIATRLVKDIGILDSSGEE